MTTPAPRAYLPLPPGWPHQIQAALLHVLALAQYVLVYTRGRAAQSRDPRVRQAAEVDQLRQEVALLREELRLKDARMARIPARQRPHYLPTERLAVLELRAARSCSLAQTARVFQVTEATVASWTHRLDEEGRDALLRTRTPVNKFPDFVRYVVQRLQALCPQLGKVKIAQILARAGLHLGASTVGRLRRQPPAPPPLTCPQPRPAARRVVAQRPNHIWHVDLTAVPISAGLWTSWLPLALPQCWPFCWWVAVVLDHYSRRVQGLTVWKSQPTSAQVRQFLGRVIAAVGTAPKYLVTDSGVQFTAAAFTAWCGRYGIRHRKGALGKHGSIAVVERFFRTLKDGCTRLLVVVALRRQTSRNELHHFVRWYNRHRPHMTLDGATPDEVYYGRRPACRAPRGEPRAAWPRASPCARPPTLVKGQPGAELAMVVTFPASRHHHLPRVALRRVA
jgi:transposase InsO family protein